MTKGVDIASICNRSHTRYSNDKEVPYEKIFN